MFNNSLMYKQVEPDLRLQSVPLCRGLFETFLGGSSVVPDARAAWAAGERLVPR